MYLRFSVTNHPTTNLLRPLPTQRPVFTEFPEGLLPFDAPLQFSSVCFPFPFFSSARPSSPSRTGPFSSQTILLLSRFSFAATHNLHIATPHDSQESGVRVGFEGPTTAVGIPSAFQRIGAFFFCSICLKKTHLSLLSLKRF